MVEQEYGASISMLIEMSGLATFRRYERACLERVIAEHDRVVIATAGGIVVEPGDLRAAAAAHAHGLGQGAARGAHEPRDGAGRFPADGAEPRSDGRPVAILEARSADYARAGRELDTSGDRGAEFRGTAGRSRSVMSGKRQVTRMTLADQGFLDLGAQRLEYRMIGPRPDDGADARAAA